MAGFLRLVILKLIKKKKSVFLYSLIGFKDIMIIRNVANISVLNVF